MSDFKVLKVCEITVVLCIFLWTSCSKIFNTAPTDLVSPDTVLLMAPSKLFATGFVLMWSQSRDEDFVAYKLVYDTIKGLTENSPVATMHILRSDTSFKFIGLKEATTYYFKVILYSGTSHSQSNELAVTTTQCTCGTFVGNTFEDMILIPHGCFHDSAGFSATVSYDYYIDTTEVTQNHWYAIVKPDTPVTSLKPMIYASFNEIILFCNKKSIMKNRDSCYVYSKIVKNRNNQILYLKDLSCNFRNNGYRLPTEDEWEYALRAGVGKDCFWGKNIYLQNGKDSIVYPLTHEDSTEVGQYCWWYGNNQSEGAKNVALKKANPWRVYDMLGNVSEYVWDCFNERMRSNRLDYTGPTTTNESDDRIVRGGNYADGIVNISGFARFATFISNTVNPSLGFRTVCTKSSW